MKDKKKNPYGDDAGTRVGRPSEPKRANKGADKSHGSGQEGTQGSKGAGEKAPGRSGEAPKIAEKNQHVSGYGGEKGEPKRSSDQR